MKKILLSICALAALLSCSKELNESIVSPSANGKLENSTFTVVTAKNADNSAKTILGQKEEGGNRPVYWQESDCIIVNGYESTEIQINPLNPSVANFVIGGELSYPYLSAYPASAVTAFLDNNYSVLLPAVQQYTEESYDPSAAVMLGYAASGDIEFHNVMSYLKVVVSGGSDADAIKSVRVRANYNLNAEVGSQGREAMSGVFTGVCSESGLSLTRPVCDNSSVTLDCGDGVDQGEEMIIAIPANTYKQGISLLIVDVNDHCQEIVSAKQFVAEPGIIYSSSVKYDGGSSYVGAGIYSAADWNAFAAQETLVGAASEFEDENGVINLYSDISTTKLQRLGGLLKEDEGVDPIISFEGVFDGNGHTVTTTGMGTPLFSYINGTVKNMNLSGTKTTVDNTGHGTLMLGIDVYGTVDNVNASYDVTAQWSGDTKSLYFGLVRYIAEGGVVKNCDITSNYDIPKASVTKSSKNAYIYVLPLASSNMGTIDNCTYSGNITIAEDPGEGLYIAPVQNNLGTISNFTNIGNVVAASSLDSRIAGVAVYGGGNFTNCVHGVEGKPTENGTVSLTVRNERASAKQVTIGGIAAYGEFSGTNPITKETGVTTSGYFTNCKNYADMILDNRESSIVFNRTAMGGIVGDVTLGTYAETNNNNYCAVKGSSNSGHLTMLSDAKSSKGYSPMYLGGIVGLVLPADGIVDLKIVNSHNTTENWGVYFASAETNMNTGTLEMTATATAGAKGSAAGVSYGYVGGIAGFVYGLAANYSIIRGSNSCIIKVGCINAGSIVSGGILGGCCYTKLDSASTVNVEYQPTSYKVGGTTALYRGMIAGAIGFALKQTVIRGATTVTLTDNTNMPCSSDLAATKLIGFAGMTTAKSPDTSATSSSHALKITKDRSSYNGSMITDDDHTYSYGNVKTQS